MKISKIKSIKIEGRGRYRDIYGNPYWAWKADVNVERHNHNVHMILYEPMSWGTSSESRVLDEAIEGINQTLDINRSTMPFKCVRYELHGYFRSGRCKKQHIWESLQ